VFPIRKQIRGGMSLKIPLCADSRISVPFGAGSSVEGNFSTPFSGLSIDFGRMDKMIKFNPEEYAIIKLASIGLLIEESMDVVVQPAVNWMDLNKTIADSGLFLPLDPSPTVRHTIFYRLVQNS